MVHIGGDYIHCGEPMSATDPDFKEPLPVRLHRRSTAGCPRGLSSDPGPSLPLRLPIGNTQLASVDAVVERAISCGPKPLFRRRGSMWPTAPHTLPPGGRNGTFPTRKTQPAELGALLLPC